MERCSGDIESSNTTPNHYCGKNDDENEVTERKWKEFCKNTDGGSSINSSVQDGDYNIKPNVRPYAQTKTPRLRWTPELHWRFVHAVEKLGGKQRANPKMVLQLMKIKELNIACIKSHLQMYRNKKIIEHGQDVSWNCHGESMDKSTMGHQRITKTQPGFYSIVTQKGSITCTGDEQKDEFGSWLGQDRQNSVEQHKFLEQVNSHFQVFPQNRDARVTDKSRKETYSARLCSIKNLDILMNFQKQTTLKRKIASNCNLDLNLSLGIESKSDDKNLSLSLCAPSLSKLKYSSENDDGTMKTRRASTLDLTLSIWVKF